MSFYTESNLVGNILTPITSTGATITFSAIDRITGLARVPQSTTNLWVLDKGTATNPNPNWELVYTPDTVTTTSGVTTLTNCVRGLAYYGSSLVAVTANQKAHIANAEIGVADVHILWNFLTDAITGGAGGSSTFKVKVYATEAARDADITAPVAGMICGVTGTRAFYFYVNGTWYGSSIPTYADATARDAAITVPVNGMKIYNSGAGAFQGYVAGAWANEGTSTTPNMSTTVAGKGEEATAAEIIANTQVGGTLAELIVNPKFLGDASVTVGAGAVDGGKYARTVVASGLLDSSILPPTSSYTITPSQIKISGTAGETLAAGDYIYKKASDSKIYKASQDVTSDVDSWNVLGVITTGGAVNAAIIYQPLVGEYTTSGLTAGATYYLGTGGTITATKPTKGSATIIPVIVGVAKDTTTLVFKVARLQRTKVVSQVLSANPTTVTVGFSMLLVEGKSYYFDGTQVQYTSGVYDVVANVMYAAEGSTAYFLRTANASTSTTTTVSVSSNNLVFVPAVTGGTVLLTIYEAL